MNVIIRDNIERNIEHRPAFDLCPLGRKREPGEPWSRGGVIEIWKLIFPYRCGLTWELQTQWYLPETYERGTNLDGTPFEPVVKPCTGLVVYHTLLMSRNLIDSGNYEYNSDCDVMHGPCWEYDSCKSSGKLLELLVRNGSDAVWAKMEELCKAYAKEFSNSTKEGDG